MLLFSIIFYVFLTLLGIVAGALFLGLMRVVFQAYLGAWNEQKDK